MRTNRLRRDIESGVRPFLSILAIVGIGEFLVMTLIIRSIPSAAGRDIVDAVALVMLITAPMYILVFRPMQNSRRQAAATSEELNLRMVELTRTADAIDSVMRATAPQSGENFFKCLVEELARALNVRHVLVSELLPGKPERVRSLAFWGDGRLLENIEYPLAGTPCENVVGKSFRMYHRNVQQLFPEDKDLNVLQAESYLGIPLFSSGGDPLGILVALSDRAMSENRYTEPLFKIVASRTAAEIERLRIGCDLDQSGRELRAVYDNSPVMIFLLDGHRRVKRANRTAQEFLGISQPQVLNMRLGNLLGCSGTVDGTHECGYGPRCSDCSMRLGIQEANETGQRVSGIEVRPSTPRAIPAAEVILLASVARVEVDDQRLLLVCAEDVTSQRYEEQQRGKAKEVLDRAERLQSLATMAGGVAHDLNNMLGPLVGYAEMILRGLPQDSPYLSKMNKIHDSAANIADVVQDLLALARRGRYEMKETQLNDVVSRFVGSVTAEMILQKHGQVKLALGLGENLPPIMGSKSHLTKVILNLTSNACEAMPSGGLLTITTSVRFINRLPSGYEEIEPGEYAVLQVRDSGVGIAAEDLQRIFDPFFSRKTMSSSGSGLGLAVVYGVVKDHRGYYDVASELGNGTEFSIFFPVGVSSSVDPQHEVMAASEHLP
jgi:signal transduction histidine kinase